MNHWCICKSAPVAMAAVCAATPCLPIRPPVLARSQRSPHSNRCHWPLPCCQPLLRQHPPSAARPAHPKTPHDLPLKHPKRPKPPLQPTRQPLPAPPSLQPPPPLLLQCPSPT